MQGRLLEDVIAGRHSTSQRSPKVFDLTNAWSKLRTAGQFSLSERSEALKFLEEHRYALHIGESQVKLLLAVISMYDDEERIVASVALILSVWMRRTKSIRVQLLRQVAETFCNYLQEKSERFSCEAILVLGAALLQCPTDLRTVIAEEIIEQLKINRNVIINRERYAVAVALAGTGYAITAAPHESILNSITEAVLALWEELSLDHGMMLLRLFEFLADTCSSSSITALVNQLLIRGGNNTSVMAAAGLLRSSKALADQDLRRRNLESLITGTTPDVTGTAIANPDHHHHHQHRMQCVSLAVASCQEFPSNSRILFCLTYILLYDILNLSATYEKELQEELSERIKSLPFTQVGAIARALYHQYRTSNCTDDQYQVHSAFRDFTLELYHKHRIFSQHQKHQLQSLNTFLESAFLSSVLFFSTQLNTPTAATATTATTAAEILDSLSCVEFIRNIHLPQYEDLIKRCVNLLSTSPSSSTTFLTLIPPYNQLVSLPGCDRYTWHKDGVQASRVSFYLRIIPATCLPHLSTHAFAESIAPMLFLYLWHPVAESAHALFATFLSLHCDNYEKDDVALREQLSAYYLLRSIQGYPQVTPFNKGLVTGVGAIARHLPAGNPAIVYCIATLIDKASLLFRDDATVEDAKKIQTLLLHLVLLVDIQVFPHLLRELAKLNLSLPLPLRTPAIGEAFNVLVADSDDCVRKPIIVPWLQSLSYLSSSRL